jgi:hypothetical protein
MNLRLLVRGSGRLDVRMGVADHRVPRFAAHALQRGVDEIGRGLDRCDSSEVSQRSTSSRPSSSVT